MCRRFGTLYLFHLSRWCKQEEFLQEKVSLTTIVSLYFDLRWILNSSLATFSSSIHMQAVRILTE